MEFWGCMVSIFLTLEETAKYPNCQISGELRRNTRDQLRTQNKISLQKEEIYSNKKIHYMAFMGKGWFQWCVAIIESHQKSDIWIHIV